MNKSDLHFNAVAAHVKVADALRVQANSSLAPIISYLESAIKTAKERQVRYQLPWEEVRETRTYQLTPLDSLLRIPKTPRLVPLVDWPDGAPFDLETQAFVIDRSQTVHVTRAAVVEGALHVQTSQSVEPGSRLVWCGHQCQVGERGGERVPGVLTDGRGEALTIRGDAASDGEQHWIVVVEGKHEETELMVDGHPVPVEVLRPEHGLTAVRDASGRSLATSRLRLEADEPPAAGALVGTNGARYEWKSSSRHKGGRGKWIQLLPPEREDGDAYIDPRAAFCEGDVGEVWTNQRPSDATIFKVIGVDADRFRLRLEKLPPRGKSLMLPVSVRNLHRQRRAARQLASAPLPYHQGLLRLCEDPSKARWPRVVPERIDERQWRFLTSSSRDGTGEQRRFVSKALASPDFAFLEGPPGSGKTTAICELIAQLIERGQRVLLCSSTHVAVDNVMERMLVSDVPVDAVRIGKVDRVDDTVRKVQIDEKVAEIIQSWNGSALGQRPQAQLKEMAERAVIMSANLTCGTTMGIVNHPVFEPRSKGGASPLTRFPHWDVLIVDEASKMLISEFLVPAIAARKWVIVGDVRQLPPFTDRSDIVANLRMLSDGKGRSLLSLERQRARLLMFRLLNGRRRQHGMRWLIVEKAKVLDALQRELSEVPEGEKVTWTRVVESKNRRGARELVSVDELRSGVLDTLRLASSDWVLVEESLLTRVEALLPGNLLPTRPLEPLLGEQRPLSFRLQRWARWSGDLPKPYRDKGELIRTVRRSAEREAEYLSTKDFGGEVAWRLIRLHELRGSDVDTSYLGEELNELLPKSGQVRQAVHEISDIAMPSILEVLQDGIGEERSKRKSALTLGLRDKLPTVFDERFESLTYQHRMHPDISRFPRQAIYRGTALKDANTIYQRSSSARWTHMPDGVRSVWADVRGHESAGVNQDELREMKKRLRGFFDWARVNPPATEHDGGRWQVACLTFYTKQERAISRMLQELTGENSRRTRFLVSDAPVEIVCGTVDRFQGREADIVLLSLRNTRRNGFLDSMNRLNVGVTRARELLVVIGNADYFGRRGTTELKQLVNTCLVVGTGLASTSNRRRNQP